VELCCSTVKINISFQLMHDEGVALSNHLLYPSDGGWRREESSLLVPYISLPQIDRPFRCIESLSMSESKVPQSIVTVFFLEEKGKIERRVFLLGIGMRLYCQEMCRISESEEVFIV
jgi:hypothetical protein